MKNFSSELKDGAWLIVPLTLVLFLFCGLLYHKKYHCVEVEYNTLCEKCVEWETKTNGRYGKFKKTYTICVKWYQYNCIATYDSCSCNYK